MAGELLEKLRTFNQEREPAPLQLKYNAMAESEFRYFRGTSALYYDELLRDYPLGPSPLTWICGDLHIENFGCYRGSNGLVYFDMNDFDEAIQAPLLWEISRLTASVLIAATESGYSKKEKKDLVNSLLLNYRQTLQRMKSIDIERKLAKGLIRELVDKVSDRKQNLLLRKRTDYQYAGARLLVHDHLLRINKTEKKNLLNAMNGWLKKNQLASFQAVDAGFRIAGTGSIGVKRYLFLTEKISDPSQKKLIDAKQALPSTLQRRQDFSQPTWQNDAVRIITIQEMMQHVSPALLAPLEIGADSFVVKELQPTSDKINLSQIGQQQPALDLYMADLGRITASAQLRSSGRLQSATADELRNFASNENWVPPLIDWVTAYALKIKMEYREFYKAWKEGYFKSK